MKTTKPLKKIFKVIISLFLIFIGLIISAMLIAKKGYENKTTREKLLGAVRTISIDDKYEEIIEIMGEPSSDEKIFAREEDFISRKISYLLRKKENDSDEYDEYIDLYFNKKNLLTMKTVETDDFSFIYPPIESDKSDTYFLELDAITRGKLLKAMEIIPIGNKYENVIKIMGKPAFDREMYTKGKEEIFISREITYYLRKKDKDGANGRYDEYIDFSFDIDNHLTRKTVHINGITFYYPPLEPDRNNQGKRDISYFSGITKIAKNKFLDLLENISIGDKYKDIIEIMGEPTFDVEIQSEDEPRLFRYITYHFRGNSDFSDFIRLNFDKKNNLIKKIIELDSE